MVRNYFAINSRVLEVSILPGCLLAYLATALDVLDDLEWTDLKGSLKTHDELAELRRNLIKDVPGTLIEIDELRAKIGLLPFFD